jgi:signal transduction histidine kinase
MNTVDFTILAGIVIAALALLVAGILIFAMRKVIQNAKQEESHKTELQKAIIATQESEREEMANNLHDDIGPQLNILAHKLVEQDSALYRTSFEREEMNDIQEIVETLTLDLRRYTTSIFPHVVRTQGLIAALRITLQHFQPQWEITFQSAVSESMVFPDTFALPVFRIYNELLNNLAKHAKPQQVDVELYYNYNEFIIHIDHNGDGLTQNEFMHFAKQGKGRGCSSILNRIDQLRGNIHLWNNIEISKITIDIPYEQPKN